MASYSRALLPLCACFRGDDPGRTDWTALLALANHTLTTPSLAVFVRSQLATIPADVAAYVRELHERNAIRNDRLNAQLEEAVLSLNRVGITPVLVKGTATLATIPLSDRALRLMSDLDLVVGPNEIAAAMKALAAIGYSIDYESDRRHTKKWYADLKRSQDVGTIDLHEAFPGQPFYDQTPDELRLHLQLIRLGGASALVPSPELQALMLVVHDQFQDYDYWTGCIDLRHLLDLKAIFAAPGGFRWELLETMTSSAIARNALETQLLLLTTLFDVQFPVRHRRRMPKLRAWRQLYQARFPAVRYLLLPMGLLDLRRHRARPGPAGSGGAKKRWFPKVSTFLFLLSLSRRYRAGKL
ncbi:nucleotidyltransferase family protein [Rhodopseudomonas sp. P2A-2r]|uniref:nucleotidyltransferase family protein n=1 Tax=Rhodopseudomonas sp. P2A-2r TaxID=2991972 RepID=UPI002234ACA5|nr:nucleotidyltransferase family protein [Rhodopseudomonas sp. P2A-2r]UZE48064.1 nucleotidyltransferase family protein [Rhodopseudomonas sp. P2A-2r]